MAGNIKTNSVTLGDSATDSQNFQLRTNVDGTATLARGAAGNLGDILTVDASGKVSLAGLEATSIGATEPSTAKFTSIEATSNVSSITGFKSVNGSSPSTPHNVPITIFTLPSNGIWKVYAWLANDVFHYGVDIEVMKFDASIKVLRASPAASNISALTMSGSNVQATQASGATNTIRYTAICIAFY